MKESKFIEQNNQKWDELEITLQSETQDPKEKSRLFIQVVDDLSYARTFYKNRSVREYLNGMAHLLFTDINLNERFSLKTFFEFFTVTFPKAMYFTRRSMLVSFIIFVTAFAIGALTASKYPEMTHDILGDDYIATTEENIANDDPMGIYKDMGEFEMFVMIAVNNLRVAFLTFVTGVLSSIGSIYIMLYNGIMVGVFQYFFFERGLFWPSFLGIWTHGTIEIACIIVAGGAGIQLGKGLLFPGTYTRAEAFKSSAKSALAVICGITPLIILAAFIESFLTRHTEIPDAIRFSFIMLCLAFVLFYFFWYPRYKYKNVPNYAKDFEVEVQPRPKSIFNEQDILKTDRLLSLSIGHLLKYMARVLLLLAIPTLLFALVVTYGPTELFLAPIIISVGEFRALQFFTQQDPLYMATSVIAIMTLVLSFSSFALVKRYQPELESSLLDKIKTIFLSLVFSVFTYGMLSFGNFFSFIALCFFIPLLIQTLAISNYERGSLLKGASLVFVYLKSNWGKFIGLNLIFLTLAYAVLLITQNLAIEFAILPVFQLLTDQLQVEQQLLFIASFLFSGISFFGLIYLYNVGAHLLFFTLKETNTAEHLFTRIKTVLIE